MDGRNRSPPEPADIYQKQGLRRKYITGNRLRAITGAQCV
ncbi:hypothetical protein BRYFOR_05440 [Marvinbryantia formatexigens DSM 14469]|uniref:Uncharacterized protein n=1 Tax=Marvinbryantia formatexigens DSM 14469 TaxID=478749 RepID=C6L9Z8_9FIRM|nr:hypothetical protein BRYFOR_05440 [Marvinbryantia formatexigens DSM 14469]